MTVIKEVETPFCNVLPRANTKYFTTKYKYSISIQELT